MAEPAGIKNMHEESVLKYDAGKGFGEVLWVVCQVCWNHMKLTFWENGEIEENCPVCHRMEAATGINPSFKDR